MSGEARHLYPVSFPWRPAPQVRLVRAEFVHGRQYGIDVERYGKPYVYARFAENGTSWVLRAGPFATEDAATTWIQELS